jgi:hypothetical protein
VRQSDGKKKPESVLYYNKNKCGVDMLDSMCKQLSTKAACRRWPMAVLFNILDLAGVNAWVLFRKSTGSTISRRDFIHELALELTEVARSANTKSSTTATLACSEQLSKRVNCQVKVTCNRNRTVTVCCICKRATCGKCMANICSSCKDNAQNKDDSNLPIMSAFYTIILMFN